ncbi:MAG: glutathione S-transferase N-terminal domain-containing protein [Gaiellales bacterium]
MRLHYLPGSAAVAPHAALAEAGADYELVRAVRDDDGRATSEYLALNPSGRVPTLEDGALVLTESAGIVVHVADRFPDAALLPPLGTDERSDALRWLFWLTNTVQPTMLHVLYPERYGTAGVEAQARADAAVLFDRVDAHLAGRDWLVGEARSGADLFLFMVTRWARHLDPRGWDRPNLAAHYDRTAGLPGVARMLAEMGIEARPTV